MERLQKVIAQSGVTSRRKAEELIKEGKVKVNGVVVTELGTKVSSKDEIAVNDRIIEKETKEYYLLNKPRGGRCLGALPTPQNTKPGWVVGGGGALGRSLTWGKLEAGQVERGKVLRQMVKVGVHRFHMLRSN